MRRGWLNTPFGIWFVAIGLFAVCVAVPLIVIQDVWFVATGESSTLWLYDKALSYLAAGVAAVFSVARAC
jgi:hypothetical protein